MEIIANAVQTVPANQNVYFTDTVVNGNYSIDHRDDIVLKYLLAVILLFLLERLLGQFLWQLQLAVNQLEHLL